MSEAIGLSLTGPVSPRFWTERSYKLFFSAYLHLPFYRKAGFACTARIASDAGV
jgi:hypothetical protein